MGGMWIEQMELEWNKYGLRGLEQAILAEHR